MALRPRIKLTKLPRFLKKRDGLTLALFFGIYMVVVALFFGVIQTGLLDLEANVRDIAAGSPEASPATLVEKAGDSVDYSVDQNTGKVTFITNTQKDLPVNLAAGESVDRGAIARQFMREYGGYFGVANSESELLPVKARTDEIGMYHMWFDQLYEGVPVFSSQVVVHVNDHSAVTVANGRLLPDINVNTQPTLSEDTAEQIAKQMWLNQFGLTDPNVIDKKLYVLNKGFLKSQDGEGDHLVWKIQLYNQRPTQHESYFIDAHDGGLVEQITGIKTINRRLIDCSLGSCVLDFSSGGYTYGRSEGQPIRGANPFYGLSDIDNGYDITGSVHEYYNVRYGRNGANNAGGLGDGNFSAKSNTDNYAYIDYVGESCPNAYFDGFSINFCRGLMVDDLVGHEYGHAVVDFSVPGGLTYAYESGALHEGLADIFGEALENYRTGTSDWEMGNDIVASGISKPIRSLKDPTSIKDEGLADLRYPDKFSSGYMYCGAGDLGGVHHNSTVLSHADYLMTEGGSFNGCSIGRIGRAKAEAVFYRAVTDYFTSDTDFNGAYNAINAACSDLYSSSDCDSVRTALQATEMDKGGYCSGQTSVTPTCSSSLGGREANLDPLIAATSGPGQTTRMQVYNRKGNSKGSLITGLFPSSYKGGSGVVSLDANNNTVKDQVAIFARANGGPQVRVLGLKDDGSQVLFGQMFVFDKSNRDGLSVTSGDFDYDSYDDDLAVCLTGETTPIVRIYQDVSGIDNWKKIGEYRVPFGNVGCNLGTFQYDDKADEVLIGPYQGPADPIVYIYTVGGTMKNRFHAYGEGVVNGVTPSGIGSRIYTTPNNGTSHVNVFDKDGNRTNFWWVYANNVRGDFINVAGDIDADGIDEIITAPFGSNGPHILSFEPSGQQRTFPNFFAFDKNLRNGVGIAVMENWYGKN